MRRRRAGIIAITSSLAECFGDFLVNVLGNWFVSCCVLPVSHVVGFLVGGMWSRCQSCCDDGPRRERQGYHYVGHGHGSFSQVLYTVALVFDCLVQKTDISNAHYLGSDTLVEPFFALEYIGSVYFRAT